MGNRPESDDDLQIGHGRQFALQVAIALADFRGGRLVGRRQATYGVGDAAVGQTHGWIRPFVRPQRFGNAGKTKAMQGRIEQFASHVTGERATSAICSFFARAEADHDQAGIERAQRRNRQGMPIRVAPANVGEVFCQAGAGSTVFGVFEILHGRDGSMAVMQPHWDIFCRVIDNYGDIGVCWRLARQLASEHDLQVRLWVDELPSLQPLCPTLDLRAARQHLEGVEIVLWNESAAVDGVADVIIEAFACELPAAYVQAMAESKTRPCWINLEYLTAEPWAESCHGLASPHPSLPLVKYFFFPGFSPATGGLLREAGLLAKRDQDIAQKELGDALEVSLFCYDSAPLGEWLEHLAKSPQAVRCYVPPGKPLAAVTAHLGGTGPWQHGNLRLEPIPFLSQQEYDRLLWRCDINFVRGEDSFVRAQWAARPFVWQIYQQAENAHIVKLDAFLERYCAGLAAEAGAALCAMFHAWNSGQGVGQAWAEFLAARPQIAAHNANWAKYLAQRDDLATALVKFCASKV